MDNSGKVASPTARLSIRAITVNWKIRKKLVRCFFKFCSLLTGFEEIPWGWRDLWNSGRTSKSQRILLNPKSQGSWTSHRKSRKLVQPSKGRKIEWNFMFKIPVSSRSFEIQENVLPRIPNQFHVRKSRHHLKYWKLSKKSENFVFKMPKKSESFGIPKKLLTLNSLSGLRTLITITYETLKNQDTVKQFYIQNPWEVKEFWNPRKHVALISFTFANHATTRNIGKSVKSQEILRSKPLRLQGFLKPRENLLPWIHN